MIQPGDVVFDIGAHVGIHTILMAKTVGENGCIVAFEPDTKTYVKLLNNINLNLLRNVQSISIALGNNFHEAMIHNGRIMDDSKNEIRGKVKIIPGDALVKEKKLPVPQVVKIDVEGFEYFVISGLQKTLMQKECRIVCCEIHPTALPAGINSDDVTVLLETYGFNRIETHPNGNTFHVFCYKAG